MIGTTLSYMAYSVYKAYKSSSQWTPIVVRDPVTNLYGWALIDEADPNLVLLNILYMFIPNIYINTIWYRQPFTPILIPYKILVFKNSFQVDRFFITPLPINKKLFQIYTETIYSTDRILLGTITNRIDNSIWEMFRPHSIPYRNNVVLLPVPNRILWILADKCVDLDSRPHHSNLIYIKFPIMQFGKKTMPVYDLQEDL